MQPNQGSYLAALGSLTIDEIPGISVSLKRRLGNLGVSTVHGLVTEWSERDLLIFGYWIGRKSIKEINNGLLLLKLRPLGSVKPRQNLELLQ
jgi:hypothetical protein